MADELIAIAHQHVHSAEGMVGVVVIESLAEGVAPQSTQVRTGRGIHIVAIEHCNIHDSHPR